MLATAHALQRQFELDAAPERLAVRTFHAGTPLLSHASSRVSIVTVACRKPEPGSHFPESPSSISSSHDPGVYRFEQIKLKESSGELSSSSGMMATSTKGWTPEKLVALGSRMQHVPRVSSVSSIKDSARLHEFIKEYEASGVPLIIEDWEKTPQWPGDKLFGVDWLLEHGDEMIAVRDCVTLRDKEVLFKEFIEKSRVIPEYAEEDEDERLYGKDAVCPKEWRDWLLQSTLPDFLKPDGSEDLLDLLPEPERVETLMCYYGVGDTFTAAHKDLCASSGHNLMCSAERGGSAFWFMTRSSDAARAASYFQKLGSELDHEIRVATPEEFAKAPFTVYVCEQRVGDLVLVPRRSCHQVVNHGGITAKMSWSRMTIEGLCTAFHHELPVYRRVCRSETYRVKLLVYRALLKYTGDLERMQEQLKANRSTVANAPYKMRAERASSVASQESSLTSLPSESEDCQETDVFAALAPEHKKLVKDVRTLLDIYNKILKEEHQGDYQCEMRTRRSLAPQNSTGCAVEPTDVGFPSIPAPAMLYHDGLTCDFCGADIFQSFFECRRCFNGEDNLIVCPGCYIEGRTCDCTIMTPTQQFPTDLLFEAQNRAQRLLNFGGYGKVVKALELSHLTVDDSVEHPGMFSAACQLLQVRISRRNMQSTYACRKGDQTRHNVPAAGAINCKKCHAARCFKHILKCGSYVADALMLQLSDGTHEEWHSKHTKTSKKVWAAKTVDALKAEEIGGPCDMRVALVLYAEKFTSCRPMCNKVKYGWYDTVFRLKPEKTSTSTSTVEGFKGAVLGEDGELTEDSTEVSSDENSVYRGPVQKHSRIKLRLNMKSLAPLRRTAPRSDVYALLDRLTKEDREKFYWRGPQMSAMASQFSTEPSSRARIVRPSRSDHARIAQPNLVVVRTRKGSRKRPPGVPADRFSSQRQHEQESHEELSSDEEQIYDVRKRLSPTVKVGPPIGQKRNTGKTREVPNPSRYQAEHRFQESRILENTIKDMSSINFDERVGSGSRVPSVDFIIANKYEASNPSKLRVSRRSATYGSKYSLTSKTKTVSDDQASYLSSPSLTEIMRILEKNEQDIRQSKQEKKEIMAEVEKLRKELAEVRGYQKELREMKVEITRLTKENSQIRRQLDARPAVNNDTVATPDTSVDGSPQLHRTPSNTSVPASFVNRKSTRPVSIVTYKKDNPASAVMSRIPNRPPSLPSRMDGVTPVTPSKDDRSRKRRLDMVVGDRSGTSTQEPIYLTETTSDSRDSPPPRQERTKHKSVLGGNVAKRRRCEDDEGEVGPSDLIHASLMPQTPSRANDCYDSDGDSVFIESELLQKKASRAYA
ncbi:hypothetical protein ACEPAI_4634 [Sanghuangporus weigelae]